MKVSAKEKTCRSSNESWGLGLLLVLFLDDEEASLNSSRKKKKKCPSLISRAQSTISICALLIVFTILLFTLFTPSSPSHSPSHLEISFPRRWLVQNPKSHFRNNTHKNPRSFSSSSWLFKKRKNRWISYHSHKNSPSNAPFALQGMGSLFQRGNRAMRELLVAHLTETTKEDDFRLFLRTLHRSGLTTRSDVVFIFPFSSIPHLSTVIQQENESSKILRLQIQDGSDSSNSSASMAQFAPSIFKSNHSEPIWGYKNHSNSSIGGKDELGELNFGSVVGFEAAELDPEGSLAGFLNPVPMQLRRWACYQMLLGRVRRNFKQVMLVGVDDFLLLRDPFVRLRTRTSDSVHLWTEAKGKESKPLVNASILMGAIRSVRRLSSLILMEIVRVSTQRKGRTRVSDSAILTHLVWNTSLLKKVKLALESLPSSYPILSSNNNTDKDSYSIIHRGDFDENLNSIIIREICSSSSSTVHSSVYRDC